MYYTYHHHIIIIILIKIVISSQQGHHYFEQILLIINLSSTVKRAAVVLEGFFPFLIGKPFFMDFWAERIAVFCRVEIYGDDILVTLMITFNFGLFMKFGCNSSSPSS